MKLRREKITDDLEAYYRQHDWVEVVIFTLICLVLVGALFALISYASASAPKDTSQPPKAVERALERLTAPHKVVTARITQYGPTGHRTASGVWPKVGMVATSDRSIPFGTKVLIAGKVYTVADRTASWVHTKFPIPTIDIYSPTPKGMTVLDVAYVK